MANQSENKKSNKRAKHRNFLLKYVVIPATFLLGNCKDNHLTSHPENPQTKKELKSSCLPEQPSVLCASQEINFRTDTLDIPPFAAAYNTGFEIIRNFVPNHPGYKLRLSTLAHEQKHKDNFKKGLRAQKLTPLLYTKMCIHDEISANICELLTMRYEYLAAENEERKQDILKKYCPGRFGYYFKAIKDGKIIPDATDEQSRQKEWELIAQGTQKMWMEKCFPAYRPSITRMVERYIGRMDEDISSITTDKGYKKVLDIAYNIGGIDFRKYMENDISFSDNTIELMDKISKINLYGGNKKDYFQRIKINLEKFKQQNKALSPEIVAHTYIAEGLKMTLNGISKEVLLRHPNIISSCYNRVYSQLTNSQNIDKILSETLKQEGFSIYTPKTQLLPDEISNLYSYKGIDLSKMIFAFKENLNEKDFIGFTPSLSLLEDNYTNTQLQILRNMSKNDVVEETPVISSSSKAQPRRSAPLSFWAPNFNEPILEKASEQQKLEIYECIRKFDSIPEVMKGCDLKAQAAYLKKQNLR